jgi:hypothetical protein
MKSSHLLRLMSVAMLLAGGFPSWAQQTRASLSFRVLTQEGIALPGATAELVHKGGGYRYQRVAGSRGFVLFDQVMPGEDYQLTVTHLGYQAFVRDSIVLRLDAGEILSQNGSMEIRLSSNEGEMPLLMIERMRRSSLRLGSDAYFGESGMARLPSLNRNFHDYLRLIPQARISGDGAMAFAGQNNRFNALYIDGASAQDILGLAANGTNGGQTGAAPVSMEALEEIRVVLNPQDLQFGNFTGGSIQAITRSGTNRTKAAAWLYYRNEQLTGRSPEEIAKPGSPGQTYRPRLTEFNNRTFGAWTSGAIVRNRLFYFILLEDQQETRPQPFNPATYAGDATEADLQALADTMKARYGYDPGSYAETSDDLRVSRINLKIDWNQSLRDKFSLSYRYNQAVRTSPRLASGARSVAFSNLGFRLPATTHTISAEWNHAFLKGGTNRMLFSFTNQLDDRTWIGQAFPRINIRDGRGTITLGADAASSLTKFAATEVFMSNNYTRGFGNNSLKLGLDLGYSEITDIFASSNFGQYTFDKLYDFLKDRFPTGYTRSYSVLDESRDDDTMAGARYRSIRGAFFAQNEFRAGMRWLFQAGIRLDVNTWPDNPPTDSYFNDSALPVISRYHDLKGARSGQSFKPQLQWSPRVGVQWTAADRLVMRAGTGLISGHVVNVWASNMYNQGTASLDLQPVFWGLKFQPDPYRQPTHASLGINPGNARGDMNLVVSRFRFPAVWRSSFSMSYSIRKNLRVMLEGLHSLNLAETRFRQVNILPPVGVSPDPGARTVYTPGALPARIPIQPSGSNPYTNVILMDNHEGIKGNAWSLSLSLNGHAGGFEFSGSYTVGESRLVQEITGANTPSVFQWQTVETIHGRNDATISLSDNHVRHRLVGMVSWMIPYVDKKTSTQISLVYEGRSGTPFSYVLTKSMINDNGSTSNFDLAYIPTRADLEQMNFRQYTSGQVTYTAQQQRDLLDDYINGNAYLKKKRGGFAQRNAALMPFSHLLDMRFRQDFVWKCRDRPWRVSLTADISNLLNLLNHNWGWQYFVSSGNTVLYSFEGFSGNDLSKPVYQYTPLPEKPYSLQPSTLPGNSARWSCQLGIRLAIE